jgi:hypothetical protein
MLYSGPFLNTALVEKIANAIDFSKDIPEYFLYSRDYNFWFFERELIISQDLFSELVTINNYNFAKKVCVSFGNPNLDEFSYYLFDDSITSDITKLNDIFNEKFLKKNTYPIIISNENLDWIGLESLHEELGVIAVKKSISKESQFIIFLDENLINPSHMKTLLSSAFGKLVQKLLENYHVQIDVVGIENEI